MMDKEELALIERAMREQREIVLLINPGVVLTSEVTELFGIFDRMSFLSGGRGYRYGSRDVVVVDGNQYSRITLTPKRRWFSWWKRRVTMEVKS